MTPFAQVDTGRELVRVTWAMMRSAINATYETVTAALNEIGLPGQVIAFVVYLHLNCRLIYRILI